MSELDPQIQGLLETLPREPGVYLLKDRDGTIIYIGKAKDLSARVRSYFTSTGDTRAFVPLLGRMLGDIETIVTRNEKEALLLENTLIKQHKPRFNVMMRDDKSFLVLRLDPEANYPRLEVTRRIKDDGARYFGPYHSASACRETLRVVNRYFQLRTCTDRTMTSRSRPCLQYQIERCLAPCVFEVDREQYAQQIEDVTLFLRGKQEALIEGLNERMREAAEALDFELAARLRDQIAAVERSLQRQQVVGSPSIDQDVFGVYREGSAVDFAVLNLRGGKLLRRQAQSFSGQEFPDEELLSSFVNLYYDAGADVPQQILVPLKLEDAEAKVQWLTELRGGGRVELLVPQRGDKRQLIDLAHRNARTNFESRRKKHDDLADALARMQQRLRLAQLPRRIECYDVSSISGQLVVASMVVLQDGAPQKASYRRFKVDLGSSPGDDFAALYQVLARRLRRAKQGDAGWELPDLLVVDGGKGQLGVALAAFKDAELDSPELEIIALAKERDDAPDRVFLPGVKDPIRLRPGTAELYLLSRIRDEAHRFAISYHKELRRKRSLKSGLDEIPGIGPKRRQELLRTLGSLKRVKQASVEELAAVPSMTTRAAEAVVRYFAGGQDDDKGWD